MGKLHKHSDAVGLLKNLELGSSIAEQDTLLEAARIETSAYTDLLADKVDLIPGTKGSGKSALFRIFVDFLPGYLVNRRKVVVAHGIEKYGNDVFHVFKDKFEQLSEEDFVSFWFIYFTSLSHEQFIKSDLYKPYLRGATKEIQLFKQACEKAKIPEIKAKKSLKDILEWALYVLKQWSPKLKYKLPQDAGEFELDLFGNISKEAITRAQGDKKDTPCYIDDIKNTLGAVLKKANLSIWLMIDRLDEIFPRNSDLETRALRGLLRTMREFNSSTIRVKIFLRDDILDQLIHEKVGFPALSHITARRSITLKWSEEQIRTMLVKRIFADEGIRKYFKINKKKLKTSNQYCKQCFYYIFPPTVHGGPNQSPTHSWVYNHVMDGKGIVTPRDILDLVTSAKQIQQDLFSANPESKSPWIIGPQAILEGLEALSKRRKETYLHAEFPHLWPYIEKFQDGKSEYTNEAISKLIGKGHEDSIKALVSIGFLKKRLRAKERTYWIPYLYRKGLNITQGRDR